MDPNFCRRRDAPTYGNPLPIATKAPWTTARCNRLLRPLTSRINLLRKGKENHTRRGEQGSGSGGPDAKPYIESDEKSDPSWIQTGPGTRRRKTYAHRKACPEAVTSASRREPILIATPGEVTVPTPVIIRARDTNTGSAKPEPYLDQSLAKSNKLPYYSTSFSLSVLKTTTDPVTWQLYEGLSSGLDALLRATTTCDNRYSSGPRSLRGRLGASSLLSMCLRRVPEYIKVEEMWDELESQGEAGGLLANSELDVASTVFSELESLGTSSQGGWNGLLEVVRSHGIRIIRDSLRDGVLCERVGEVLVWVCVENMAFDEAEAIISTMISVTEKYPEPTKINSPIFHRAVSIPLAISNTVATMYSRRSHQFRELEALFRKGRLCKEWLTCCDFTKIWQEAIRALTERNPDYPGAMLFVTTAIELTWGLSRGVLDDGTHLLRLEGGGPLEGKFRQPTTGRRRPGAGSIEEKEAAQQVQFTSALDNTVYSVVTTLASIAILNQRCSVAESESVVKSSGTISPTLQLIHHLKTDILRASQLQHTWPRHAAGLSRRVLPALLAGLFTLPPSIEDPSDQKTSIPHTLTKLVELSDSREDSMRDPSMGNASGAVLDLAYCINSITVCCTKATEDGGFPHISYFIEILRSLVNMSSASHDLEYKDKQCLHQIAMESSYEFAEQNRTDGLLKWAQDVEHWSPGGGASKFTPAASKVGRPQHGYQWECDLSRLATGSPRLATKYCISQNIDVGQKQPKPKPAPNRNRGDQNGSDFEESGEDCHRTRKRHRKNQLPKTPKISNMAVGKHHPTSSPLIPVDTPIHILSSPMDQLSRGHTTGFGNLPTRLKTDRQQRVDGIKRGQVHIQPANINDIDELGKPEPAWDSVKNAISRNKPKRQCLAERSNQSYPSKVEKCCKVAERCHWMQGRVNVDDFSEDELLG